MKTDPKRIQYYKVEITINVIDYDNYPAYTQKELAVRGGYSVQTRRFKVKEDALTFKNKIEKNIKAR